MGNFFESLRLTGIGWVFAFFIVGATILAGRWLLGLGLAKFKRDLPGELDGKATRAGVAAPLMPQARRCSIGRTSF
jgi:hypothetical protein